MDEWHDLIILSHHSTDHEPMVHKSATCEISSVGLQSCESEYFTNPTILRYLKIACEMGSSHNIDIHIHIYIYNFNWVAFPFTSIDVNHSVSLRRQSNLWLDGIQHLEKLSGGRFKEIDLQPMRKQRTNLAIKLVAQRNSNSHWPWEVVTYWLRRCVSQMFKAATFRPLKVFSHKFHTTGITVCKEICIFEVKMEANWSHTFEQQPFSGKSESQTQPNEAAIHSNQVSHPTPLSRWCFISGHHAPRCHHVPGAHAAHWNGRTLFFPIPRARAYGNYIHENTSLTSLSGVNGLGWFLLIWHAFIMFASWCIVMYDDLSRFYHDVSVWYGVSEGHVSKSMSFTWNSKETRNYINAFWNIWRLRSF